MRHKASGIFILSLVLGLIVLIQMFYYIGHLLFNVDLGINIFQYCLNLLEKSSGNHLSIDFIFASLIVYTIITLLWKIGRQWVLTYRFERRANLVPSDQMGLEWRSLLSEHKNVYFMQSKFPFAYTFGLFHPKIVLSNSLLSQFSHGEIKAILLQEECHQRSYDPLKTFLLTVISESMKYIPLFKDFLHRYRTLKELLADQYVMNKMYSALELGSALLKLIKFHSVPTPMTTVSFSDMDTSLRIQQILEPNKSLQSSHWNRKSVLMSMLMLLLISLVVLGGCS